VPDSPTTTRASRLRALHRLAMILSGGIALIWTDQAQGGGWTWPEVYRLMALLMVVAAALSALVLPRLPRPAAAPAPASHDLRGFLAVLAAVAVGVVSSERFGGALAQALLGPWLAQGRLSATLQQRWVDLLALLLGIAFTLPLAAWAARSSAGRSCCAWGCGARSCSSACCSW
jgi:PAT family beta-lactamase induction signal transducer AmpG